MSDSLRYFFRVEYDGTAYAGWQRQDNAVTVQETLEKAFSTVTRTPCGITGAGRTDAGVHAGRQGAHLDATAILDLSQVERSVNAVLPPDIGIFGLQRVGSDFHARFSAVRRNYRYSIATSKQPLLRNRVWVVWYAVDWDLVLRNIDMLPGTHDFTAFCAADTSVENMVCTIHRARLERRDAIWNFSIEADRFVYKMVRNIVGTLIDIGRGRLLTTVADVLESKNRRRAGSTAPACGLILENVEYPAAGDETRRRAVMNPNPETVP